MSNEKEGAQSVETQGECQPEVSLARRRLVKTALMTTPAVITLYSGSARALASGLVHGSPDIDDIPNPAADIDGPLCFPYDAGTSDPPGYDIGDASGAVSFDPNNGCPQDTVLVAASSLASVII